MTFTFIQDNDDVKVFAEPACRKRANIHICTVGEWTSSNPIITWHVPFGMAGTMNMLTKFKTWKAKRE